MDLHEFQQINGTGHAHHVLIARAPEGQCPGCWFAYLVDSEGTPTDVLTIDSGCPVSCETLDEACAMLHECGHDGSVLVAWEPETLLN